jgi:TetR/AcrR family transcriptional regulator, cholesterol catabolism regulator
MTERVQPKRIKSEITREAILQNALKIFDRRGFANTSLEEVARETGLKREAIYYYFGNRAEILLAIIRPQSEALVESLREIVTSEESFPNKLHLAFRNHLMRFDRNCLEMTVSLRDVYLDDAKDVRREMTKIWRAYETMWTELILGGQRSGDFAKVGDPKMIAFGILGMCNWLARWYDPKKSTSVDELVDTYFNMIAHGLVATRSSKRAEILPGAARQRAPRKTQPTEN